MSKYMAFESESFANGELLVDALKAMGFSKVVQGEKLPLQGWDKRDVRVADIVIRKIDVKHHRLLGDIGFQRTQKGYAAVVDDMDLTYSLGRDFIRKLQTQYHEAVARKTARNLGGTLIREQVGKTVKIRVRF